MQDIIKKLKFRDTGTVVNAPQTLEAAFVKMGFTTTLNKKGSNKNTLIFIPDQTALLDFLNKQLKNIEPDSVLWLAYPKGSSGVTTDINRDTIRVIAESFGITTVTAISINEVWSGLRFRPIDRVGK